MLSYAGACADGYGPTAAPQGTKGTGRTQCPRVGPNLFGHNVWMEQRWRPLGTQTLVHIAIHLDLLEPNSAPKDLGATQRASGHAK